MSKQSQVSHAFFLVVKDGHLELADNKDGEYKRYWKMLAGYGDFVDPNGRSKPMTLNKEWAQQIVDNYKTGPIKDVPVPFGHPKNSTELALQNKGWLVDAEARDDGLYGLIEIRDDDAADKVEKGLVNQTSVAFDDIYQDKKTGKWYKNVLRHVGMVVDPYIKGMTEFQPALADMAGAAMLFSDSNNGKEENAMSKVKNERDFGVTIKYKDGDQNKEVNIAPGAEAEVPEAVAEEVAKQITDAQKPETAEEKAEREKREAEEAAKKNDDDKAAELEKKEQELAEKEANLNYNKLLSDGKIVPAQKDAFIALSKQGSATVELSDGNKKTISTLLTELFENGRKVVALDDEKGGGANGGGENKDNVELTDEEKSLASDFGNTPEEIAEYKKSQGNK